MNEQFNSYTILDYLCQSGVNGKNVNMNDLLKKYFPSPQSVTDCMNIRFVIQNLKDEGYIATSDEFRTIGSSHGGIMENLDNVRINLTLTQKGFEYWESKKKTLPHGMIQIIGSTGINVNSPNSTQNISINYGEINDTIQKMQDVINNDTVISESKKIEVNQTLSDLQSEISQGAPKNETLTKILQFGSQIAGIGSLSVNLLRLMLGI
jgi:hypothetical protein